MSQGRELLESVAQLGAELGRERERDRLAQRAIDALSTHTLPLEESHG